MFDKSIYNDEFFAWHQRHVDADCNRAGFSLYLTYKMRSLADWGCGIGSFLMGAKMAGCPHIQGFEIGGLAARKHTNISIRQYINFDMDISAGKILLPKKAEISICAEVAEHIEPDNSERLIENICNNTSDMIIFTAAPPGQDGAGHINCRPRSYWQEQFHKQGFEIDVEETLKLAELWKQIAAYYLQNLMVFK